MNLAIMQPYFFPYLGYWQLLDHVDRFVIYDDVNYIKGGWINRNRILINGAPRYITVPLRAASPNRLICETRISENVNWRDDMLKTFANTYRKAPYFEDIFPLLSEIISTDSENLSNYLGFQINAVAEFLGITTDIIYSSKSYDNRQLSGQERILDICSLESATTYTNSEGGAALYSSAAFAENGVSLQILSSENISYKQRSPGFHPRLSIIDTLMEVGESGVKDLLHKFSLDI